MYYRVQCICNVYYKKKSLHEMQYQEFHAPIFYEILQLQTQGYLCSIHLFFIDYDPPGRDEVFLQDAVH